MHSGYPNVLQIWRLNFNYKQVVGSGLFQPTRCNGTVAQWRKGVLGNPNFLQFLEAEFSLQAS